MKFKNQLDINSVFYLNQILEEYPSYKVSFFPEGDYVNFKVTDDKDKLICLASSECLSDSIISATQEILYSDKMNHMIDLANELYAE